MFREGSADFGSNNRPHHDVRGTPRTIVWTVEHYLGNICLTNLQKTYGSIDYALLWEVLDQLGVPSRMVEVISLSRDVCELGCSWIMVNHQRGSTSHMDSGEEAFHFRRRSTSSAQPRPRTLSSIAPFPPKVTGLGRQNLHLNRHERSEAKRAARNSHTWVRFSIVVHMRRLMRPETED